MRREPSDAEVYVIAESLLAHPFIGMVEIEVEENSGRATAQLTWVDDEEAS